MNALKEKITALSTKTKIIIIAGIGITLTLSGILINWQTNRAEYDRAWKAYSDARGENKKLMDAAAKQIEECKVNALPGYDDCLPISSAMRKVEKLPILDNGEELDAVNAGTDALTAMNAEVKKATSEAHAGVKNSALLWKNSNLKPEIKWSNEAVERNRKLISESDGKVSDPGLRNNLAAKTDALEKLTKEIEAKYDSMLAAEAKDEYAALHQAYNEAKAAEDALKAAMTPPVNLLQPAVQPTVSKQITPSVPSKSSAPARKAGGTKTGGTTSTGSGTSSGGTTAPSAPATGGGTSTGGSTGGQNGWVETGSEDQCLKFDTQGNSWSVPC
ncbi:hypothetical protein [Arcanobacterium bovis]|uniref:Uncharacterized protein n=1 Tax=Arcanobacterium bovis TaxID=2529275 RepID=A0A4Q9V1N6_9ACTO|nr:hypothetical protein [Arcanobacterium bovis]TBW21601.1 hypothetical protein EZJ44_06640 [Arcanobacterium bovis]